MNSNYRLDMSYIAGVFDVKGVISIGKSSILGKFWKMEISLSDKNVMELIHETLGRGELREKKIMGKKHWRWSCRNQDCLFVAKELWAHTIIKLHKIEQIIDHYEPEIQDLDDNVVELDKFRKEKQ